MTECKNGEKRSNQHSNCTRKCVYSHHTLFSYAHQTIVFILHSQVSLLRNLLLALTTKSKKCYVDFSPLMPFLRFFVYLQGSQGNQKKVFTVTCEDILDPLLRARSLLTSHQNSSFSEEFIGYLDNVIKQIFNK